RLRQAEASTILVTKHTSQPPCSKIVFDTVSISSMSFWQDGRKLWMQEGSGTAKVLAENLRYLVFSYGETDNDNIMSVSVTFEKDIYSGRSKALQMAVEKVRIMND
ncbi:MAG: hypothetical protein HY548_02465, partial [Elusimicrobia bacterium]|nr:hypothetical protein [Elusimicrobiota bacterium]